MTYFDLIPTTITETKHLEFKVRLNEKDQISLLKTIAGFANTEGGKFVIGVKDTTYELQGFLRSELDAVINYFNNQINIHIVPKPVLYFDYPSYKDGDETRFIIQIKVDKSKMLPVIVKSKGFSLIYVREEGQTIPATPEQITNMVLLSDHYAYDTVITNDVYNREQFNTLFSYYRNKTGNELSEKFLASIGFFDVNMYLSRGALLFRDDANDSITEVQCAKWPGLDKGSELMPEFVSYRGDLLSTIDFMVNFIKNNSDHGYIKTPEGRKEISSYPARSILEGVVNAVAHRNYYISGGLIEINIYRDRLEIVSPGSFLGNEELDKDTNLSDIRPIKRNVLICDVLAKCRLMEKDGSGFDLIEKDYAGQDKQHLPFVSSDRDSFTLTLPSFTYVGVIKDSKSVLPQITYSPRIGKVSKYDEKILSYCYANKRSIAEIASFLGLKISTHLRKNILESLVMEEYLYSYNEGHSILYETNQKKVSLI